MLIILHAADFIIHVTQKPLITRMTGKKKHDDNAAQLPIWKKALKSEAHWNSDDKDEFLDVVYWLRQLVGIILGIVWGILPLKGFVGILLFCSLNAAILYVYITSFQKIDEEEYGGTWELTKEGFMTSFASFLVAWITVYSALYYG